MRVFSPQGGGASTRDSVNGPSVHQLFSVSQVWGPDHPVPGFLVQAHDNVNVTVKVLCVGGFPVLGLSETAIDRLLLDSPECFRTLIHVLFTGIH